METRKLVKAGASSHTISLPKSWLEKNKLNAGDVLYVGVFGNDLRVCLHSKEESVDKSLMIRVDRKSLSSLSREITSAYINNYTTINLVGDVDLDVRSILQGFVGLEISEQSEKRLVIKDFLNMAEVDLDKIVRQMDMLIRCMLKDVINGGSSKIDFKDKDVNRLYFLVMRILKSRLKQDRDCNVEHSLALLMLLLNLENFADLCKSLSVLGKSRKMEKYVRILGAYECVMKSFFTRNKVEADSIASSWEEVYGDLDSLPSALAENAKAMVTIVNNIARIVIDEDQV
jgi:phosphate uptake regulator